MSQLAHAGGMIWGKTQWLAEKQLLIYQIWNRSNWEGVNKSRDCLVEEAEGWWFWGGICRNPMTDWLILPWLPVPRWCKLKRQKEDSIIIINILFPQLQLDESPGAQRGQQNPFLRIKNITGTSAVAMKVRKVRSTAESTTDDTSLWIDKALDSNLIMACDLSCEPQRRGAAVICQFHNN